MNSIERAKAKLERLEAVANNCAFALVSIVKEAENSKSVLTEKLEQADKSEKALINTYIKKCDKVIKSLGGAENE